MGVELTEDSVRFAKSCRGDDRWGWIRSTAMSWGWIRSIAMSQDYRRRSAAVGMTIVSLLGSNIKHQTLSLYGFDDIKLGLARAKTFSDFVVKPP